MLRFLYDFDHNDGIIFAEADDLPIIGESVVLHDGYHEVVAKVLRIDPSAPDADHLIYTDFTGLIRP